MIDLDDEGPFFIWNVIESKEIGRRYNPIFIPLDEKNTRILIAGGNRGGNYKADAYTFDMNSEKISKVKDGEDCFNFGFDNGMSNQVFLERPGHVIALVRK